jgi:predicted CXXCH cytochrome family protein
VGHPDNVGLQSRPGGRILNSGWIGGRYLGMTLLFLVLAGVVAPLLARRSSSTSQPVPFNHSKHTQDLGLNCEFCHKYVRTSAHSGLPGVDICSICHLAQQGESEASATVTELITAGNAFQFNKLFKMPANVFYTHRRHVAVAGLECDQCHGSIGEMDRSPNRPLVNVTMDFCMDCHTLENQSLDCNACHR